MLQITANGVNVLGGGGQVKMSFEDYINPKPQEAEKTGDEIALEVIKNAGLKVVG